MKRPFALEHAHDRIDRGLPYSLQSLLRVSRRMRGEHYPVHAQEGIVLEGRFLLQDFQSRSRQFLPAQRLNERLLINKTPARGVDQDGRWLDQAKRFRTDEMARLGSQGSVQREEIGF